MRYIDAIRRQSARFVSASEILTISTSKRKFSVFATWKDLEKNCQRIFFTLENQSFWNFGVLRQILELLLLIPSFLENIVFFKLFFLDNAKYQ